jgi:hypothetical protein
MYGLEGQVDVMIEAKGKEHALLRYRQAAAERAAAAAAAAAGGGGEAEAAAS